MKNLETKEQRTNINKLIEIIQLSYKIQQINNILWILIHLKLNLKSLIRTLNNSLKI